MRKIGTILVTVLFLFTANLFGQVPDITTQPEDQGVIEGQTATFNVIATGDTLTYQWYKDNVLIPGATDSAYATPPVIPADNGSTFSVKVTNSFGSDSSNGVVLYVTAAGSRVTSGLQVLYDFKEGVGDTIHDKSNVGTPLNLEISNLSAVTWTPEGLGTNDVAYINSDGPGTKVINSAQATNELTIEAWFIPAFTNQDSLSIIFCLSDHDEFNNFSLMQTADRYVAEVRTTGTSPGSFLLGGGFPTDPGVVTKELTHLVFTRADNGIYKIYLNGSLAATDTGGGDFSNWWSNSRMQIANDLGEGPWLGTFYLASVYNRALSQAEVTENYDVGVTIDHAPEIIIQPQDQALFVGDQAAFSVNAVGDDPLSYQWKKNGVDISGANSRTYSTSSLALSDDGSEYSVSVSNGLGLELSRSAELDVSDPLKRVTSDQIVLYNFQEGTGDTIRDVSGFGSPLNLAINTPASVQWKTNGLQVNASPSITSGTAATKVNNALTISSEFTFEMWVAPDDINQIANIFTISSGANNTNFTANQFGQRFNTFLRTSSSSNAGTLLQSPTAVEDDSLIHVAYTYDTKETSILYIDGVEVNRSFLLGDLSNWNSSYSLKLVEQAITNSQWTGLLNLIAVYKRALNSAEIAHNYSQGPAGYLLNAPTNLTANLSPDSGKVELTWDDNASQEVGYEIERRINTPIPSSYSVIDTIAANDTSYVDENISDTTSYSYRVRAFDSLFVSLYSNEATIVSVLISVSAPTNLTAELDTQDSLDVNLSWADNATNEIGFVVERKLGDTASSNSFTVLDTLAANHISYTDSTTADSTTYTYRVYAYGQAVNSDFSNLAQITTPVITGIISSNQIPKEFALSQNYPNPFNPSTTIRYALPSNARVTLTLYNTLGQQVAEIFAGELNAGTHEVNFNASDLSSGVYFYRLEAHGINGKNFISTKRMLLLK